MSYEQGENYLKRCYKCGIKKPLTEFYQNKLRSDGVNSACGICACKTSKKWRLKNKGKLREQRQRKYRENPDKHRMESKRWADKNPNKVTAQKRRYREEKSKDITWKLNDNMSSNIRSSLKRNKGGNHWESLVGYTVDDLKKHIEKLFVDGMSWENREDWHIDHVIPKSVFNFENPEHIDFKRCWALDNLQPMWAKENYSKGAKLNKPFQPSLPM